VYVLPATEQAIEDFQSILREIVEDGGEASICRSTFVDGLTDAEIEQLFREARARDYAEITAKARTILKSLPTTLPAARRETTERRAEAEDALARLRRRFAAAAKIDFFEPTGRRSARELLDKLEARLTPPTTEPAARATRAADVMPPNRAQLRGRTWVTREGVFVDRIASAWLIRRFIDPEARFAFVAPEAQPRYRPRAGELRFDMFDAEYTHEGDRCTFETLVRRFDFDDPALAEIAEIVHDIDLKDGKFDREDAAGIERVLAGIAAAYPDDVTRLERGGQLFDELYTLLRRDAEATTSRTE
jgi:hypothetical protein